MKRRTILITGGTSGVGKAIAKAFAHAGDDLTIVGRNPQKAAQAVKELTAINPNVKVEVLLDDLANKTDNLRIATEFSQQHRRLDVLVNSAGNIPQTRDDNLNLNLRSHYWLTHHLTSLLTAADSPRVYIVTGMPFAIKWTPIYERQHNLIDRGLWLLTHKTLLVVLLAAELKKANIMVNAIFPGGVQSNLLPWTKNITNTSVPFITNIADPRVYQHTTGNFFDDQGKLVNLSARKYNPQRAKKILTPYLR